MIYKNIIIILFLTVACSNKQYIEQNVDGYTEVCIDGKLYLLSKNGADAKIDKDNIQIKC